MPGIAEDISLGGVYIATKHPAPFGASVLVRLELPGNGQTLVLTGLVRWTGHDGMGIQFGALGARETHALINLARGTR